MRSVRRSSPPTRSWCFALTADEETRAHRHRHALATSAGGTDGDPEPAGRHGETRRLGGAQARTRSTSSPLLRKGDRLVGKHDVGRQVIRFVPETVGHPAAERGITVELESRVDEEARRSVIRRIGDERPYDRQLVGDRGEMGKEVGDFDSASARVARRPSPLGERARPSRRRCPASPSEENFLPWSFSSSGLGSNESRWLKSSGQRDLHDASSARRELRERP